MRSVFLMLTLSVTQVQLSSICPESCVVCTEDAIICHKLSSIVGVPDTTKALMLTDGEIDSVDDMSLSDLSNMTVLGLSNNAITIIMENAFQNLTVLRTLLLDHNHISGRTLNSLTFSWLCRLEILQLGNNALRDIDGSWFQYTRALKTLQLEGNLLTRLNSSTFALSDLRNLETLDLSNNLITHVGQDSFRNVPRLRSLDLSRNRLQNTPDAFSYLSWLSALNMDLNRWNCTCELRELASFLSSYIQAPDKVLYNGQRMVCVSADNPAVHTVLQLTEANCVPPNRNITVQVEARKTISPQRYTRDVALAAACFFAGGVGIALGLLCIVYRKLELSKRLQERNGAEEIKKSTQGSIQWDFAEDKEALSLSYDEHGTRKMLPEHHFTCHNCRTAGYGPDVVYQKGKEAIVNETSHGEVQHRRTIDWSTQEKSGQWTGEHLQHFPLQSKSRGLRTWTHSRQSEDLKSKTLGRQNAVSSHHGTSEVNSSFGKIQQLTLGRPPPSQRNISTRRTHLHNEMVSLGNHIRDHSKDWNSQPNSISTVPVNQTISCLHCHRTYEYKEAEKKPQYIVFGDRTEDNRLSSTNMYQAMLYRETLNYNRSKIDSHGGNYAGELGLRFATQRSVTFDLPGSERDALTVSKREQKDKNRVKRMKLSKNAEHKDYQRQGYAPDAIKTRVTEKGHHSKSYKKSLKVKINLNPFRKGRIHPKGNQTHEQSKENKKSKKNEGSKSNDDADSHSTRKSRKGKSGQKSRHKKERSSKRSSSKDPATDPQREAENQEQGSKDTSTHQKQQSKKGNARSDSTETDDGGREVRINESQSDEGDDATNQVADSSSGNKSSAPSLDHEEQGSFDRQHANGSVGETLNSHSVEEGYQQNTNIAGFIAGSNADPNGSNDPSLQTSIPLTVSQTGHLNDTGSSRSCAVILNASGSRQLTNNPNPLPLCSSMESYTLQNADNISINSMASMSSTAPVVQEYLCSAEGSPKRKIRLILPEKSSNRPQTALEKKIR